MLKNHQNGGHLDGALGGHLDGALGGHLDGALGGHPLDEYAASPGLGPDLHVVDVPLADGDVRLTQPVSRFQPRLRNSYRADKQKVFSIKSTAT